MRPFLMLQTTNLLKKYTRLNIKAKPPPGEGVPGGGKRGVE